MNTPAFENKKFDFSDPDGLGDDSSNNGLDDLSDGSVMRNVRDGDDVSSIHSLEGYRRKRANKRKAAMTPSKKQFDTDDDYVERSPVEKIEIGTQTLEIEEEKKDTSKKVHFKIDVGTLTEQLCDIKL